MEDIDPRTGKKRRPKNPALVLYEGLRYSQVLKNRKEAQKVEKQTIFCQNIGEREILTNLFERKNLTFRQGKQHYFKKGKSFQRINFFFNSYSDKSISTGIRLAAGK
jgi:hypothetical protein